MSRTAWIGVMIALGLGLALRLVSPSEVCDLRPRADALEYDVSSSALAKGEGYALPLEDHSYPPRYTIGYPLLTAAVRVVSGELDEPGLGVLVSLFAGLLVIVFGALLAHELGGDRAAIAAALLLALSPLQVFHSRQVMSDAAALALLLAALAFALRWARSPQLRPRTAWTIGFLGAFGATVRLTNGLVLPFLFFLVLTRPFGEAALRRKAVFGFLVGCAVGLAPQMAVNLKQFGELTKTGYSYWIPSVYDSVEGRAAPSAFALGAGFDGAGYGEYGLQLVGWNALQLDLRRVGLLQEERSAPAPEPALTMPEDRGSSGARVARESAKILLDRGLEPRVLYPFPVALLALLGLGMRGRGWNVSRSGRALRVLAGTAFVFFAFYGAYSFRELRFLLPVQALVLIFASRVFATARAPLRTAAWCLVGLALVSALPDLSASAKTPQGTLPYGRANEETLALRWIASQVESDAIIAVRTHGLLFERELLGFGDRLWVPIGRDEHRLRIDALKLEETAPKRRGMWGSREHQLAQYRAFQLDLDQSVIDLMTLVREIASRARPILPPEPPSKAEEVRRDALALLAKLPSDALEEETRDHLRSVLERLEATATEIAFAVYELARHAVLQSFAHDLEGFAGFLEQHPRQSAYLCDLYLFEYGIYEDGLRAMLETGTVPAFHADGAAYPRPLAPPWRGLEKVAEFHRPGFPEKLAGQRTAFALYLVKRGS